MRQPGGLFFKKDEKQKTEKVNTKQESYGMLI